MKEMKLLEVKKEWAAGQITGDANDNLAYVLHITVRNTFKLVSKLSCKIFVAICLYALNVTTL